MYHQTLIQYFDSETKEKHKVYERSLILNYSIVNY